jgi:hypothetical protein
MPAALGHALERRADLATVPDRTAGLLGEQIECPEPILTQRIRNSKNN